MVRSLAAAFALVLLVAAVAVAAPDRAATVSADAPTLAWDGNVAAFSLSPAPSQETCTKPAPGRFCDETLIEVEHPGTLEARISGWNEDSDLDLFLLASDADGTFGDELGNSLNSGTTPEKVSAKVTPGFYLVFVNYFQAVDSGYKGTATLKSTVAPAAPQPPAPEPPAPAPSPQPSGDDGALPREGELAADVRFERRKIRRPSAVVNCTAVCEASLRLVVDRRTARRYKLSRRATTIGRATTTIDRKDPPPVTIRLTRKAAKRLKKARTIKATLRAVVTDASGGQRQTARDRAKLRK